VILDPLIDSLLSTVASLREQYVSHITTGSVANESSFREMRGVIQGIDLVTVEIKEIANAVYGDEVE
jgi:hypothetical protein